MISGFILPIPSYKITHRSSDEKTKYINTKPKNLKARHTNSSSGLFSKNIGRGKKVLGTRLHDIQIEASTHLTFPF